MLKTTTWSPDTCDCTLHYEWDTDTTEDERVHTPVEVSHAGHPTQRCAKHSHHADVHALHQAVLAENQAKNRAINAH